MIVESHKGGEGHLFSAEMETKSFEIGFSNQIAENVSKKPQELLHIRLLCFHTNSTLQKNIKRLKINYVQKTHANI